jgi:hypothetical protein
MVAVSFAGLWRSMRYFASLQASPSLPCSITMMPMFETLQLVLPPWPWRAEKREAAHRSTPEPRSTLKPGHTCSLNSAIKEYDEEADLEDAAEQVEGSDEILPAYRAFDDDAVELPQPPPIWRAPMTKYEDYDDSDTEADSDSYESGQDEDDKDEDEHASSESAGTDSAPPGFRHPRAQRRLERPRRATFTSDGGVSSIATSGCASQERRGPPATRGLRAPDGVAGGWAQPPDRYPLVAARA